MIWWYLKLQQLLGIRLEECAWLLHLKMSAILSLWIASSQGIDLPEIGYSQQVEVRKSLVCDNYGDRRKFSCMKKRRNWDYLDLLALVNWTKPLRGFRFGGLRILQRSKAWSEIWNYVVIWNDAMSTGSTHDRWGLCIVTERSRLDTLKSCRIPFLGWTEW
jgi:hypothetical protein